MQRKGQRPDFDEAVSRSCLYICIYSASCLSHASPSSRFQEVAITFTNTSCPTLHRDHNWSSVIQARSASIKKKNWIAFKSPAVTSTQHSATMMAPKIGRPGNYRSVSTDEADNPSMRNDSDLHSSIGSHNDSSFDSTEKKVHRVNWGIDWRVPSKMIGLLSLGVILGVIHHCLYQSLEGKKVDISEMRWHIRSQAWHLRYGQALAFSAKACFAGSVALGYQQHIWHNFRDAPYTVKGISAIFAATDNPLSLANPEYLSKAKIGMVLSLIIW